MMANIITGFRVLISIALLFCPVFSPVFYVLYLIAGLADMIDGTIARRTNTVSEFGARFDTAADFVTLRSHYELKTVIRHPIVDRWDNYGNIIP